MLTLYGKDCKSFVVLFSEEETAEKSEKGSYRNGIFTPCNPRQPHFTI